MVKSKILQWLCIFGKLYLQSGKLKFEFVEILEQRQKNGTEERLYI